MSFSTLSMVGSKEPSLQIGDGELKEKFESFDFRNTGVIDLSHNRITSQGVEFLVEKINSCGVENLTLNLNGNSIGARGVERLVDLCNKKSFVIEVKSVGVDRKQMEEMAKKITNPLSLFVY